MTSKLFVATIYIRIMAETDFIVLAYTSCPEESTMWPPITSLVFLLRSILPPKIIRRGANWYPFALALRSDDGSFLKTLIDISTYSPFKIAFAHR